MAQSDSPQPHHVPVGFSDGFAYWSCPDLPDTLLFYNKESEMNQRHAAYPPEFRQQLVELVKRSGNWLVSSAAMKPVFRSGFGKPAPVRLGAVGSMRR